jgi:hypothetical protein
MTRTWDTLSMEIRAGRLTRDAAIRFLSNRGDETPWDDIRLFCEYLRINPPDYFAIVEQFRNHSIWSRHNGRWQIEGFLIPEFSWPADPAPS